MEWSEIASLAPSKLAQLLDVDREVVWSEPDITNILLRQLNAPLWPDLALVKGIAQDHLERLVRQRPGGETFQQHLLSPKPCIEVLYAIKAFAQQIKGDFSNPLHGDAAGVLYFGAIASGLVAFDRCITSLNDDAVLQGFEWAICQTAAEELRPLFRDASGRRKR